MLNIIPKYVDAIAEEDVAIVVCMLSQVSAGSAYLGETASVSAGVKELRGRLLKLKRQFLVLGGAADLWSYAPEWDMLVARLIVVVRYLESQLSTVCATSTCLVAVTREHK